MHHMNLEVGPNEVEPQWRGYPELYDAAFVIFNKSNFNDDQDEDSEGGLHLGITLSDNQLSQIRPSHLLDTPNKITLYEEVQPSYSARYYDDYNSFDHRLTVIILDDPMTTMYTITTKHDGHCMETKVRKQVVSAQQARPIQESPLLLMGTLNLFVEKDPLEAVVDMSKVDEMEAQQLVELLKSIDQVIA